MSSNTPEPLFPPYKLAPVATLVPYARNARTHSDAQVAQIAASIREFGFTNPILVDAEGRRHRRPRTPARRAQARHDRGARPWSWATLPRRSAAPTSWRTIALRSQLGWDEDLLRIELGESAG